MYEISLPSANDKWNSPSEAKIPIDQSSILDENYFGPPCM